MNRKISGIMAVAILTAMLLSAFFITAHADHDCSGEDCPICACIQQCASLLRSFYGGMPGGVALYIPLLMALIVVSLSEAPFVDDTLVSNKVRLNN